jgi:hypothetical protein
MRMRNRVGLRVRDMGAIALVAMTLVPCVIRAQANNGAPDLLFPIGARATAMGQAFVTEQGSEAIWWNPAGLARLTKPEFALDEFKTYQIENGIAASLIFPAGAAGVFGFGARLFDFGTTQVVDINNQPEGIAALRSTVFQASYAATLGPRVNAGITFRVYNLGVDCGGICPASLATQSFKTGSFDAGLQYRSSATSPLEFGVLLRNVGPSLQIHDQPQADGLPTRIHVGVVYKPTSPSWDPALHVRTIVELVSSSGFSTRELHAGGEVSYLSGKTTLLLRAGWMVQQTTDQESSSTPSIGLGLASGRVQLDLARVFDSFSTGLGVPPTYVSIRIGL